MWAIPVFSLNAYCCVLFSIGLRWFAPSLVVNEEMIKFCLCRQDDFRLMGSWSERHVVRERRVLLFQRAILFTKKLKNDSLQMKDHLLVLLLNQSIINQLWVFRVA